MTLIIPGVEISVVKEVVPQQLAPSGVLGIVGLTEAVRPGTRIVQRASSWSRFRDLFGPGTAYSIPEARQALDNGVNELVIARIESSTAAAAGVEVPVAAAGGGQAFAIRARAAGTWANGLMVKITSRGKTTTTSFDLEIQRPGGAEKEVFRQLTIAPGSAQYVVDVLANTAISTVASASSVVTVMHYNKRPLEGTSAKLPVMMDADRVVASLVRKINGPALEVTITEKMISLGTKDQAASAFVPLGNDVNLAALQLPGAESAVIRAIRTLLDGQVERNFELEVAPTGWPADGEYTLAGGVDANATEYSHALAALKDEPDVDMVLAAVQDFSKVERVTQIYSDVISHCNRLSEEAKGRIGLGQTLPLTDKDRDMQARVEFARENLVSDRFVLIAPFGVVGAVAGMIGSLPYFHSPTFKRVAGLGPLKTPLGIDEQRALLKGNVVPVAVEPSKGLVVLRGLTTDGDQISVRRVADHAVRGVKMLGDLFIGTLNNEDGRNALKQKLAEFLLQMKKEGAIVPSTDGSDPAFKVNVYSSQTDFALGVVRVELAVRPVRAIDYIYATILIQT